MSDEEKGRERFQWLKSWRKWLLILLLCALATLGTFLWGLRYGSRAGTDGFAGAGGNSL